MLNACARARYSNLHLICIYYKHIITQIMSIHLKEIKLKSNTKLNWVFNKYDWLL